jgi:hypothetical protein
VSGYTGSNGKSKVGEYRSSVRKITPEEDDFEPRLPPHDVNTHSILVCLQKINRELKV